MTNLFFKLISDEKVIFRPLGEVCTIRRGVRVVKNELSSSTGYPVFQNSLKPLGYSHKYNVDENNTFIIAAGAAGEIGYEKGKFWAADDCYYFESRLLTSRFLYHVLNNQKSKILSQVRKASIPRLPKNALENLIIPVPSIELQNEIVKILDVFKNLEAELEAELEARKKQYEYYRNLLLTFTPPPNR